jgi:hypothetical protein
MEIKSVVREALVRAGLAAMASLREKEWSLSRNECGNANIEAVMCGCEIGEAHRRCDCAHRL